MIIKPKGTKDIIDNIETFKFLEKSFRDVASSFNYKEIRTPIFENKELFIRAVGEETDVVSKEMYEFKDKGGRTMVLRPEATASVVRAVIENKVIQPNSLIKLFYMGKMFRYERPQKGRQREFNQFGIEAIGLVNAYTDLDVMIFAIRFLEKIGIKKYKLKINTLGTQTERKEYKNALKEFFKNRISNMCDDCKVRYTKNILRLLDCKNCKLEKDLPQLSEYLSSQSKKEFELISSSLTKLGIKYEIDQNLVRGLDYYTNIVFEIKPVDSRSSQSTFLGGGRYSNLVEQLGGPSISGTGFALGVERLINFLEKNNLIPNFKKTIDIYVVANLENAQKTIKLINAIREKGISVEFDSTFSEVKKQFKKSTKANANWVVIVDEETTIDNFKIKNQTNQTIIKTSIDEIKKKIKGV